MVDSPYYRPPEGPDDAVPSARPPRAAPSLAWVVVATTTSPRIAAEVLRRFEQREIIGRSLPAMEDTGEIAIEVREQDEEVALALLDGEASDLLEYRGFAPEVPRSGDDARGGAATFALIAGVLLVICVFVLLAS